MRLHHGLLVALGVAAVSGACSAATTAGGAGGGAPARASALPEVACAGATATEYATAAQGALNRALVLRGEAQTASYQAALAQAQQGITADAQNAYHYFQAGQAQVGLGNLAAADSMFDRTVAVCPEFGALVTEDREMAWARTYQAGMDAYQAGDTAAALRSWESAVVIDDTKVDTWFNLGVVHDNQGNVDQAVAAYRRALALVKAAPADSNTVNQRSVIVQGLLKSGTDYFAAENFRMASEMFGMVTTEDPNSRDAWYNNALSLYKAESWDALVPVARRLVEIDPLNYNARIILFSAYKAISDSASSTAVENQNRQLALETLTAADGLPVQLEGVQLTSADNTHTITGTVKGAAAPAGRPVVLNFTVYSITGPIGTATATVQAPAKDQTAPFTLTVNGAGVGTGYSYRMQ